jgi:hypothetical protein
MADLGTVPVVDAGHANPAVLPLSIYTVHRGIHLTSISTIQPPVLTPTLHVMSNYVVRQIRILYRQLWPAHGQRFPQ